MTDVRAEALSIVEQAIIGEPRSQQQIIGPSEVGMACTHCLAARLAGWQQTQDAAWLPWIGTAIHARLESVFGDRGEWLTETRVSVGMIGDKEIRGTADLFHVPTGTCVDFKTVGTTTMRKAKGGPSPVYRTQAHLYSLGFVRAGFDVSNVAIWYMPRNDVSLRKGIWWEEPFNPLIALEALDRATELLNKIHGFDDIEARDAYITSLPRDADCWSCARYPDAPKASPKTLEALLGVE